MISTWSLTTHFVVSKSAKRLWSRFFTVWRCSWNPPDVDRIRLDNLFVIIWGIFLNSTIHWTISIGWRFGRSRRLCRYCRGCVFPNKHSERPKSSFRSACFLQFLNDVQIHNWWLEGGRWGLSRTQPYCELFWTMHLFARWDVCLKSTASMLQRLWTWNLCHRPRMSRKISKWRVAEYEEEAGLQQCRLLNRPSKSRRKQ